MFWRNQKKQPAQTPVSTSGFSVVPEGGPEANGDSVGDGKDAVLGDSGRREIQARKVTGAYVVPAGYRITGPVFTSRPIRVEGELFGRALVAREVVVSRGGTLREPAEVDSITIEGKVIGPIKARGVVDLRPGGELQGDVDAVSLKVSPGGILSNCKLSVGERR